MLLGFFVGGTNSRSTISSAYILLEFGGQGQWFSGVADLFEFYSFDYTSVGNVEVAVQAGYDTFCQHDNPYKQFSCNGKKVNIRFKDFTTPITTTFFGSVTFKNYH